MIVSWDTEFKPTDDFVKVNLPTCVSWATDSTTGWAGPLGNKGLFHARDPKAKEFVAWALTHHISVGANIACDIATMCLEHEDLIPLAWQAYADGRVRDLIQMERLHTIAAGGMLEAGPKGLNDLCQKYGYGALDKDDDIRMTYGPLRDVPLHQWSERHRKYPVDDAAGGLHVALHQPLAVDWENASRADWVCFLMGAWGFRTHPGRVAKLKKTWERELVQVLTGLTKGNPLRKLNKSKKLITPDEFTTAELLASQVLRPNPANATGYSENTFAIKARMIASGATRLTKGGGICCDAEACEDSGDPILMALAEYGSLGKKLGSDIPALERGELHCWFKPVMTNNQTNCSTPFNAQNMATEGGVRECIIPRPGMCFMDLDYNLFQLRTLSQACLEIVGRSDMAEFLIQGRNLHSALAALILGIPESSYDKKADRELRGDKNLYDMAKRCNFGFGADMGYKRFAATCSKQGIYITEAEFRQYKLAWKNLFPEMWAYFEYIKSLGQGAQIVELFTGRLRGGCKYTDAANGYFSALAASAAKAAWFQIARECYDPSQNSILFGDRPVDFIHDQFLIETPDTPAAHDHAMRVKYIMETETQPFLPDVPATTDPCLASCFSKKAEAVFDSNKRLLVWSPSDLKEAA